MSNYKEHFDVVVVGGGIIGMLTARQLQSHGLSVAIFDKANLGGKATWAAGGILASLNPWQQNVLSQNLIHEGRQKFAALADELKHETGVDPEYLQSGLLVIATSSDELQAASMWAKQNHEPIEHLSRTDLLEYEPYVLNTFQNTLYFSNVAQIRPPKLIDALKKSLSQRKIRIYEHTAVKELIFNSNNAIGLQADNEKYYADKIIVCGGAWTKYITQKNMQIDVEPIRGQMLLFQPIKKLISHIIMKEKAYLIPRQDGHILCGSTLEHVGFENRVTEQARQDLTSFAYNLLPELAEHPIKRQWSALRPGTNREAPYICKHPKINGLYINSGHYRYGIVMSIASARIMTDLIVNSLSESQIAAFA